MPRGEPGTRSPPSVLLCAALTLLSSSFHTWNEGLVVYSRIDLLVISPTVDMVRTGREKDSVGELREEEG